MREKGLPREMVLKELASVFQKDLSYNSGKILSSMCTRPHRFSKSVYTRCLEKNLGDPSLFPSTAELERRTVQTLGSLLSHPKAVGYIVSGGTEANILALWVARNLAEKKCREVILPVSAHFSFDRAADLLGLKLVKVRLDERFQADVKAVEKAITPKTVAIVGVAGSTDLGTVDPIPELSEIAATNNIYFHVDAAFGGFVLPFLKDLGFDVPDFDFRLRGVCSITIDPHKMGLAPIPSGGILFKDAAITKAISVRIPYLSIDGLEQTTILGTRPGASAAAVWALMEHFGKKRYRSIVKSCMKLTRRLAEGISQIDGVNLVTQPTTNIIGVKSDVTDIRLIAQRLREKGWAISLFSDFIRIVIMPHLKPSHIENFLVDLDNVVRELTR